MSTEDTPRTPAPERIAASYAQASKNAQTLNVATVELLHAVSHLEKAVGALEVGIECWVRYDLWEDDDFFEQEELGYARVNGEWGFALRIINGIHGNPESREEQKWKFADAPRRMRVDCLQALPDLLDKLAKKTESATKKVTSATAQAMTFAEAIYSVAPKLRTSTKTDQKTDPKAEQKAGGAR